jgi:hypothetical protein
LALGTSYNHFNSESRLPLTGVNFTNIVGAKNGAYFTKIIINAFNGKAFGESVPKY